MGVSVIHHARNMSRAIVKDFYFIYDTFIIFFLNHPIDNQLVLGANMKCTRIVERIRFFLTVTFVYIKMTMRS